MLQNHPLDYLKSQKNNSIHILAISSGFQKHCRFEGKLTDRVSQTVEFGPVNTEVLCR